MDQVTHNHLSGGNLAFYPRSHDSGKGPDQSGEPLQGVLGPDLLDRPEHGVEHDNAQEEGVGRLADGEGHHAEDPEHDIGEVEGVGPDDRGV